MQLVGMRVKLIRFKTIFSIFISGMIISSSICHSAHEGSRQDRSSSSPQEPQISFASLMQESPPHLQLLLREGIRAACSSSTQMDELYFVPLHGGFTSSKLFLFALADNTYVLRILDPKRVENPHPNRSKRLREVWAHHAASALGIAPEVVYTDPDGLILIMRYIDGHTLTQLDLKNEKFLFNLGTSLQSLHQTKMLLPEKVTQIERAKTHYTRARNQGIAFPSHFETWYEEYCNEGEHLSGDDVLCHGDLNPANIIVQNEKAFLIDWAGATYENRFTDLGYITLLSGMNAQQLSLFLTGYFGREATAEELKKVEWAQARTCFLTAVVWFHFSETAEEISQPLLERVSHLDELLASPDLKRGAEYILEGDVVDPSSAPAVEIRKFAMGFLKEYLIRMKRLKEK